MIFNRLLEISEEMSNCICDNMDKDKFQKMVLKTVLTMLALPNRERNDLIKDIESYLFSKH